MKTSIHPTYFPEAKVTCACGQTFITGSTVPEIRVELCSNCHPFYTGTQKYVDTLGQVDRFVKKSEISKIKQEERKKILEVRLSKKTQLKGDKLSLKDLLLQARKSAS